MMTRALHIHIEDKQILEKKIAETVAFFTLGDN